MGKSLTALTVRETEFAKVGLAEGKSQRAIARELGRAPATIGKLMKNPETWGEIAKIRKQLAEDYEHLAKRFITGITDEEIKKMNPYQRVLSSGISVDKADLLRGLSKDT